MGKIEFEIKNSQIENYLKIVCFNFFKDFGNIRRNLKTNY